MATSGNIASGSAAQGQPKVSTNTGSPIQESGNAGAPASSHLYLADNTPRNASGGQSERVEVVIRPREPDETDRSQLAPAGDADVFPQRGAGESQQQAGLGAGPPLPSLPPAATVASGSGAIPGASGSTVRSAGSGSSQPASLQNRRSRDPFADDSAARRGASVPRSQVSSRSSLRERPLPLQRSVGDLTAGTGRDQAREAQRRRSTREIDSTRAPAPPLIFASERNKLIDHLLEHQPEVEEAAAAQLPLVFVDAGDEGEADASADASYNDGERAVTGKARQDEGEPAIEGYPRAPPHAHAADGRRHSLTDDILPFFGHVTGDYLYNKINPARIVPRRASTGVRAGVDERMGARRGSGLSQPARGPAPAPGPIDLTHVVPVSKASPTAEKRHPLPGSVSARLSATLRDAQEERDKYAYKAKYTGLALNIAIGLQVLLGSLTTGLSAVAVRGKSSAVATTILGALATLVASYLARSRGSNEPELSITRVKDLEQFIRECKNFEQDHGEDMTLKYQPDVERFRSRFENLLGNANGERRLSPTGGALQQSSWA